MIPDFKIRNKKKDYFFIFNLKNKTDVSFYYFFNKVLA
jgi:hypothetical protein